MTSAADQVPGWLRRLAACAPAYDDDLAPGFERLLDDRLCVFFGPNRLFSSAYPFRLADVEGVLAEVRAAARERGVHEVEWWLGPDVEPPDLGEQLRRLGLRTADGPDHQPWTTAMVILEAPPAVEGIAARPVATIDELREATEVSGIAFGSPEDRRERARADVEDQWTKREGRYTRTFGAWLDGVLVGSGRSAYVDRCALLVSGGVVPEARGRGVYRALVRARWDDAVARGGTALLVYAGAMSRPVLERVGFQPLFDIEILLDEIP